MTVVRFGENTADNYTSTSEDSRIREDNPLNNYGGRVTLTTGNIAGLATRTTRSLIRFKNIAANLGAGKVITAATLNLYATAAPVIGGDQLSVYQMKRAWVEGTLNEANRSGDTPYSCCWNEFGSASAWQTVGGDGANDRGSVAIDTINVPTGAGYQAWNILTAVQNWYDGTWAEDGIILVHSDEATAEDNLVTHVSSEGTDGQRPYLSITYTVRFRGSPLNRPLASPIRGPI